MRCGKTELRWGVRTYIMGILNVSPDSFSGDGLGGPDTALEFAERMAGEGADIVDVGGESTRPGASPISIDEELRRVIPVIERLAVRLSVPVSVDSYKYEVVLRAVEAGAAMINDQWGLAREPRLAGIAAAHNIPLVLMSNQREGRRTGDIIEDVRETLENAVGLAIRSGVPSKNIILDPGIGFGKTAAENLEIINRLGELKGLGMPLLIGPSRKSFIGRVLGAGVKERVEGTAAAVAIGIARGADMVRVHDVAFMARVCRMSDAIVRGPGSAGPAPGPARIPPG